AVLRLLDLRLRLAQLRFERRCVHASHHLAGLDGVALVDQYFLDPARILAGDVDLLRFEPAVSTREPFRQRRLLEQEVRSDPANDQDDRGDCDDYLSRHWPGSLQPALAGAQPCLEARKLQAPSPTSCIRARKYRRGLIEVSGEFPGGS